MIEFIKTLGLSHMLKLHKGFGIATNYLRGYYTFSIINALIEIGVTDFILKNNKVDLRVFCEDRSLNYQKIRFCMDYLYEIGLLKIDNQGNYLFSRKGKKMLAFGQGIFTLLYGYSSIFNNLERIFKNKVVYKKDIDRDGKLVGKGSGEIAELIVFPFMQDIIKKNQFKNILDLGCGSAEFLIDTCKKYHIKGYGIDISDKAIEYAKTILTKEKLSDSIKLYVGDVFQVQDLPFFENKEIDILLSSYVIHESFQGDTGKELVKNTLDNLYDKFPNANLLICEVVKLEKTKLKKNQGFVCEHHLWHYLTDQGLPGLETWKQTLKESKYHLKKIFQLEPAAIAIFYLEH